MCMCTICMYFVYRVYFVFAAFFFRDFFLVFGCHAQKTRTWFAFVYICGTFIPK